MKLSNQPEYAVRASALAVDGEANIRIWWIHVYATGGVDLVAVTSR